MYRVLTDFSDLQDNEHVYRAGDVFPRSSFSVSEKRIKELSTTANRRGEVLIEKVEEAVEEVIVEEQPKEKKPRGRKKKVEE